MRNKMYIKKKKTKLFPGKIILNIQIPVASYIIFISLSLQGESINALGI